MAGGIRGVGRGASRRINTAPKSVSRLNLASDSGRCWSVDLSVKSENGLPALRRCTTRLVPPALRSRINCHAAPCEGLELTLVERERLLRCPVFPVREAQVVLLLTEGSSVCNPDLVDDCHVWKLRSQLFDFFADLF